MTHLLRALHPDHHIVRHKAVSDYRTLHEPDNIEALCSTCPEYDSPNFPADGGCSDSCGPANVWVDKVTFVKLKLEGFV